MGKILHLRHFMSVKSKGLGVAFEYLQFAYNLQMSESTGASLFKVAKAQQPLPLLTVAPNIVERAQKHINLPRGGKKILMRQRN